MKRTLLSLMALVLTMAAVAQTLNVKVGSVTYQFPASQTGEMTYQDGTTLTIMGKTFTLADIDAMTVDDSEVADGTINVNYDGGSTLVVSGASQPTLKSGVTVSSGTSIFDGAAYTSATITGGSSVNLSSYTGGNGGGPGGPWGPGGWR